MNTFLKFLILMREMRYVIFWLCFIGITFYVVKRGKKYTDFHQVFSILYKLRFLLLCGFLIVIVSNFITTYDPSQSDYAIITDLILLDRKQRYTKKPIRLLTIFLLFTI